MCEIFGSNYINKCKRKCMHRALVKKVWCYTAVLVLFIYLFWIVLFHSFKDVQSEAIHINGLDIEIENLVEIVPADFLQENRSRRHSLFRSNAVKEAEFGSRDYTSKPEQNLSPLQKILLFSGQTFHNHVNDPDFKEKHDFKKYSTPRYLKKFKNPCFYKNVSLGQHTRSPPFVQLRCVPYFMIAGFPKCASTDLWLTLKKHPNVIWAHPKEMDFFHKKQFDTIPIKEAVGLYQARLGATSVKIEKCVSNRIPDFHPCITGDASVDTIFDNKLWKKLPGNQLHTEPVLTNANYVHRINPNMKIIVLLRNPVDRLYSDYIFMATSVGYVTSPEDFHNTVQDSIINYTACISHRTQRACAYDMYDDWDLQTYKVRLKIGMYHIFLADWLKVFPNGNILVLRSEDTRGANREPTLIKIFKFLAIDTYMYSRKEVEKLYRSEKANQRSPNTARMLSKTRKMLTDFYRQFNKELTALFPHIHY